MNFNSEAYLNGEPAEKEVSYVVNADFLLREIAGEYVLIPVGDSANYFNGMIAVNETFQFLWKQFQTPRTISEVIAVIEEVYDDIEETMKLDVADFVKESLQFGFLKEEEQ